MRIELDKVGVKLGGRSVLEDVCLDLVPGTLTVISGGSGCGTSVLLKTAAGLISPTRGAVLYDGRNYASLDEGERPRLQTRTGFMFQDAALWANMSLAANLDLPLQAKFPQLNRGARRRLVAEVLAGFGCELDLSLRPVELPLGEQKFVSFLRAVIPGPEALFLDEPLAGLDSRWAEILLTRLAELRTAGTTMVVGSHNVGLPAGLVDQQFDLVRPQGGHKGACPRNEEEGVRLR